MSRMLSILLILTLVAGCETWPLLKMTNDYAAPLEMCVQEIRDGVGGLNECMGRITPGETRDMLIIGRPSAEHTLKVIVEGRLKDGTIVYRHEFESKPSDKGDYHLTTQPKLNPQ